MNDRDLKYFCHLVESGNYTETARQFNVTQPAISASLKRLENEYGTTLLTQGNHRSKLVTTPAGQVLYIKSRKLIKELKQISLEVKHANDNQVRLGFSHVAGGIWIPKVLEQFIKRNLLDFVTTSVSHSANLLDELRNGKLDAAVFSSLRNAQSADLNVSLLETHQFCILVNKFDPISRLKHISAKDLKDSKIISRPNNSLPRTALEQFFKKQGIKPNIIYEADSNQLVENMVARNIGIGFVIDDSVALSESVIKIPLKQSEIVECYMMLAVRTSFLPNEQQRKCIEILKRLSTNQS